MPMPYEEIVREFASCKIDYYFAQLRHKCKDESPILTGEMARLFAVEYNREERKKNNMEIVDLTTFNLNTIYDGILHGLSKSIVSYVQNMQGTPISRRDPY